MKAIARSLVWWVWLCGSVWVCTNVVHAKSLSEGAGSRAMGVVVLAELPGPARDTYARILRGGPFPYAKDGVVFGNRERLLPRRDRGYYHEYTVPTPGAKDRGARRIVCGGPLRQPEACFFSDDHYASYRRIVP